jgi:hypothetical protein
LRLVLVCWANRPLTALKSACGACEVKTCRKRLFEVGPGTLHIMPAGLKCPVCKRVSIRKHCFARIVISGEIHIKAGKKD